MKKLLITSLAVLTGFLLIGIGRAEAQMGTMMGLDNDQEVVVSGDNHSESIEVILQALLDEQNVETIQELDLDKITDADWERLGDAVMEAQHPGDAHEAMDQMMGGEGSESLTQMHINMGKAYLGSGRSNYTSGMMMGNGNYFSDTNSSQKEYSLKDMHLEMMSKYGVLGGLTWLSMISFFVSGVYFFLSQAKRK